MKKPAFLILAASALLLAACGNETITPEQYSSWMSEHTSQGTSSATTTSSQQTSESVDSGTSAESVDSGTSAESIDSNTSAESVDSGTSAESVDSGTSAESIDSNTSAESIDSNTSAESVDSSSSEELDPGKIYFREATWWNSENVVVRIALDPVVGTDFDGLTSYVDMDYERYVYWDEDDHYCYYSVDIEDLGEAKTIQFWRAGHEKGEETINYWGAQTGIITLAERGENDLYDLRGVDKPAAWEEGAPEGASREVAGAWGTYDPTDEGVEPPSSSSSAASQDSSQGGETGPVGPEGSEKVSWYLVGEGSHFHNWNIEGGLQLWSNPASPSDKGCALNVTFAVGDVFKVTNGTDWYGYDMVNTWDDPSNAGIACFEGVNDGYGGKNFSCTVAGAYDVYVNGEGQFWIGYAA